MNERGPGLKTGILVLTTCYLQGRATKALNENKRYMMDACSGVWKVVSRRHVVQGVKDRQICAVSAPATFGPLTDVQGIVGEVPVELAVGDELKVDFRLEFVMLRSPNWGLGRRWLASSEITPALRYSVPHHLQSFAGSITRPKVAVIILDEEGGEVTSCL